VTELTLEELAELETVANWTSELRVQGERASRLLAMARELIDLRSALELSLRRSHSTNSTQHLLNCCNADEVMAFARMLGWRAPSDPPATPKVDPNG
jgi:hypothetical protein